MRKSEMNLSSETFSADLQRMSLTGKETLLIHSSMKMIGPVEGGAEALLAHLKKYFKEGLLIFPSFSYTNVLSMPGKKIFDVRTTQTCIGILPELFRKGNGVKRSLHPTHSLAAWGEKASLFIADHERYDTAFNRSGPFGRLLEYDAKILLCGVTLTSCTFLHALEEWAGVKVLSKKPLDLYIRDERENEFPCRVHWHKGAHSEMYDRASALLEEAGALRHVQFGMAPALLLDCRRTEEVLLKYLQKYPDFFLNKDCPPQPE